MRRRAGTVVGREELNGVVVMMVSLGNPDAVFVEISPVGPGMAGHAVSRALDRRAAPSGRGHLVVLAQKPGRARDAVLRWLLAHAAVAARIRREPVGQLFDRG